MKIEFSVPGKPQPKQRPRVVSRGGFARAYTPKQTKDYEALVKECFLSAYPQHEPTESAVRMDILIAVAPTKSTSKKKAAEMLKGDVFPINTSDVDNIAKSVLDSLNGVLYNDDKQVIDLRVKKQYAEAHGIIIKAEIAV